MRLAVAAAVGGLCVLTGCSSSSVGVYSTSVPPGPAVPGTTAASSRLANTRASTLPRSTPVPTSAAEQVFARMSERERVGQLLMVDCSRTGVSDATRAAIEQNRVGSVILLDGANGAGIQATQAVTTTLRSLAPKQAGLFVATDQEGGLVQRLQGPGFTPIPSAVEQGRLSPDTLRRDAQQWGSELRQAGVNVNLAPVLDVVPAGGGSNPPIGDLHREYGSTPGLVASHGLAYARGMADAGVDVAVKHFPGLGRVSANTDTTAGVTDTVTTPDDPDLAPFRAAIKDHVPFVMISTAIYSRIDANNPAAFSNKIVTGLLREKLGYRGVIISDDVGAGAQVSNYSPGQRAVRFVAAGGDMVLTAAADQAQEMTGALLARAQSDPAFKHKVDAAALRVLQAKQAQELLH